MKTILDQFHPRESEESFRKRVELNRPIAEEMARNIANTMVNFLKRWAYNNPKKVLESRTYRILKNRSKNKAK